MKLKRLPEDFQVEELTEFAPSGGKSRDAGPYALYRLSKRSIGTPEAVTEILRKWHFERNKVSYGGLKDRHAQTHQYLTIYRGPPRNLEHENFSLHYLGQASRAYTPHEIVANRFAVVMRDMSAEAVQFAQQALTEVATDGLPNYFDDQRFGSIGLSGEFIGRAWCSGDYERALWLSLADPHVHDRGSEVGQKKILRENWGKWVECKRLLERSSRRSIITFLADKPADHPDYRKAFALIQTDLRGLYLSAFQSAVWNRMLAITLRERLPAEQLVDVPLKLGPAPFLRRLLEHQAQELRNLELPLPSARLHLEPGPTLSLIEQTLQEFNLELREMRVKFPRDSFFSKGERKACVAVGQIASAVGDDEMYPGRHKLTLNFDLPRGAYATILVKRLTDAATVPDFGEE